MFEKVFTLNSNINTLKQMVEVQIKYNLIIPKNVFPKKNNYNERNI